MNIFLLQTQALYFYKSTYVCTYTKYNFPYNISFHYIFYVKLFFHNVSTFNLVLHFQKNRKKNGNVYCVNLVSPIIWHFNVQQHIYISFLKIIRVSVNVANITNATKYYDYLYIHTSSVYSYYCFYIAYYNSLCLK